MRVGDYVVPAQTAIDFGWILDGLKVVGDRNDRKQDEDEDCQRDELSPPSGADVARVPQPQADDYHR